MFALLSVVQLPILIVGNILVVKACCGRRCACPCFNVFYEMTMKFATYWLLYVHIPLFMIALTSYTLYFLITNPSLFWSKELKVWQMILVSILYFFEIVLYLFYVVYLIVSIKLKKKETREQ